jgi:tetratricopeptide (TPR) repeat protein
MVPNTQTEERTSTNVQILASRLRPAEVHSIIRQHLERLAVPWKLDPGDAHQLIRQMKVHVYEPGEAILPYRMRADFLGLLVRGQAAVLAGQPEPARPVAVLLPGITFGDLAPAGGRPSDATLQALTRCEVWFLRRADLQALADERRSRGPAKAHRGLLTWIALTALLCLLVIVTLKIPTVRQTAALVPMGLGQWCSLQGRASDRSDAYDRCVELAWTMAAEMAPADANPLLALGAFYFEKEDFQDAQEAFEGAQALVPDLAEAQNNLGVVYAQQGKHEEAISAFEEALELEPGVAAVEHNLGVSPVEHNLGVSLQALGAYAEAVKHHELALAFGEPHASTLANLAIGYYETGQRDKAAETAQDALQIDDSVAPAHTVLGALALESQQPRAALEHLRRAVEVEEDYGRAYFYLGLAHKALEQSAEAIAAFEHALASTDDEDARAQIQQQLSELHQAEQDKSPE